MDRRELEERYTAVGRPIPTDLGRMVRNVALVRLALLVGCGVTLAIGLCVFGGLAWFAIVGTRPIVASPTPTPVADRDPRFVDATRCGGASEQRLRVVDVHPGGRGARPFGARGTAERSRLRCSASEGRIKARAHPRPAPRRARGQHGPNTPGRGTRAWARATTKRRRGAGATRSQHPAR